MRPWRAAALLALLLGAAATPFAGAAPDSALALPVPRLEQRPERCGPTALAMVLRFHGATPAQVALADSAYDPVLRGALITDLAAWARRAGFDARVARLADDSLVTLLRQGLPPVVLYRRGVGPVSRQHYAVVVGWDPAHETWSLHDGSRRVRRMSRRELAGRWRAAGAEALIVSPRR